MAVLVPCHVTHTKYIDQILEDLVRSQTRRPEKINILVNPSSGDDREYSVCGTDVRIFHRSHDKRIGYVLNLLIDSSDSDFLVISGADDRYHPERIELMEKAAKKSGADAVVHDFEFMSLSFMKEKILDDFSVLDCQPSVAGTHVGVIGDGENPVAHGYACFRRESLNEIRFNESIKSGEDSEILTRLMRGGGTVKYINRKLSSWYPGGTWRHTR